jgi:hypothetical protein
MEPSREESALLFLPKISPRDIEDLARNPVIVRLMAFWDVLSTGMGDTAKKALLWETFATIRASFDSQAKAIRKSLRGF